MGIQHQYKPKFRTTNEAIVAGLREAAGAGPPIDPYMKVKRLTALVSYEMALLDGGDWRVRIDHHEGLVIIARRAARRRETL